MDGQGVRLRRLLPAMLMMCAAVVRAGPIEIVPVDLVPLIEAAAQRPGQFAVDVPWTISLGSGEWTAAGTTSTWRHVLRVPGAVSLSFHAGHLRLPAGALLTVRGDRTAVTYTQADSHNDFWSRVQPGETLEFQIEVPTAQRSQVALEIRSLQAGYRGLSSDVPDHAVFRRMRVQAAGDPDTPCVQNYACNITPQNTPAGRASVPFLVANIIMCTGTLINNTAGDATPYLITARHCESGTYGGGAPNAAAALTVYWSVDSACGAELGSAIYSPGVQTQSGATTVFEQQDFWLLRLDAKPATSVQYVGFDASGSPIQGGYSVHYSRIYNRQYTRWHGRPFAFESTGVLGTPFVSNLLYTLSEFGTSAPGSSGAALFSQNDQLVGVMSVARDPGTASGYGVCPGPAPPEPTYENAQVGFSALSAVWDSTIDATSSTGLRTLRSLLDPGGTGRNTAGSLAWTPPVQAPPAPAATGAESGGGAWGVWELLLGVGLALLRTESARAYLRSAMS